MCVFSAFSGWSGLSALASFEPALRLIDDIDAALAPHDTIVTMTGAQRFQ
jgi:hypothetical protein